MFSSLVHNISNVPGLNCVVQQSRVAASYLPQVLKTWRSYSIDYESPSALLWYADMGWNITSLLEVNQASRFVRKRPTEAIACERAVVDWISRIPVQEVRVSPNNFALYLSSYAVPIGLVPAPDADSDDTIGPLPGDGSSQVRSRPSLDRSAPPRSPLPLAQAPRTSLGSPTALLQQYATTAVQADPAEAQEPLAPPQ
jgi:hypothetical protein